MGVSEIIESWNLAAVGRDPPLKWVDYPHAIRLKQIAGTSQNGEFPDIRTRYALVQSEMSAARKFLVIDDNADGRALLTKTLMRKFPSSIIHECQDAESAVSDVARGGVDVVVVHRVWDVDGATLIRRLRAANLSVPIIAVSGIDRTKEALAAGATRFLSYDEWLRVGTIVSEVLGGSGGTTPPMEVRHARN
jgi:CheY-like chemotaxis protein